jgi:SET domain-containing protein
MNHLHPFLIIKDGLGKGRGVFALNGIEADTLIEVSPVIVLDEKDTAFIHQTHLHDYYFTWGEEQKYSAIALGYISLYNHSAEPNCQHHCDFENNTISIYTRQIIQAGEELCIDYGMGEKKDLWFKPI